MQMTWKNKITTRYLCDQGRIKDFFEERVGADFHKFFENFVDIFFRSTKLIFRALTDYYDDPILTKKFEPLANPPPLFVTTY